MDEMNKNSIESLYKDLSFLSVCSLHRQGVRSANERKLIMLQRMKLQEFVHNLFDQTEIAHKATLIIQARLEARSPRLSDISHRLPASPDANYNMLQRFLARVDPREALQRLFNTEANFVLGDATEIERAQARSTSYVGLLHDGKTRGFWLLLLATSYRGSSLPFGFVCYSSRTQEEEASSRNLEHRRCLRRVKELIKDKVLVLDREFSYESLMHALVEEDIAFAIRLNLGAQQPILLNDENRRVKLHVPGESKSAIKGCATKAISRSMSPEYGAQGSKNHSGSSRTWIRKKDYPSMANG
jgi:hypothetical protein